MLKFATKMRCLSGVLVYQWILIIIFINLLLLIHPGTGVSIDRFYPFGFRDSQLPSNVYEASSQRITLQVPIKFYGHTYSYLYVNANGLISFLSPLPYFLNIQLPLDYPVIAPFYANVDTRRSGTVFFSETNDVTLLRRANDDVYRLFSSTSGFTPTSLFIVTWSKVGYFDQGYDKVNTYQCVIISNETESYVQFLYSDDGIQWLQSYEEGSSSGLSDAKAQAGLVAADRRFYVLKGSGTDQIRNLNRWSNTDIPGLWMFRIGNIQPGSNIESPAVPSLLQEGDDQRQIKTCSTGYVLCHSQATCRDFPTGFCCICNDNYYGNGFNCLKKDFPLRANGKLNASINGVYLSQLNLQAYISVADGRSYTALSKVPNSVGFNFQLLYPLNVLLGWLFAKPVNNGKNGYQITGGVLNYSAQITYRDTNDRITVTQRYFGLDVFDQLSIEANIRGSIPSMFHNQKFSIDDYQHQFNKHAPGAFHSVSTLSYRTSDQVNHTLSLEQTITYVESCDNNNFGNSSSSAPTTYKMKTIRNFVDYEAKENILRFAATNKISLWSEIDDPCIEGRVKCVANSSCITDGDSFKCVCNPGFQTLYVKSETTSNEGVGCFDVNECSEGIHNCDQNAICVNEVGTYSCQCKPGYTGNGYYCSELESPCLKYPTLCHPPNSECTDPNDPLTCDCKLGFQKSYIGERSIGFTCQDINECEPEYACHRNAVCTNTEGSYLCQCNPGFTGDGYQQCTALPSQNGTNPCLSTVCEEGSTCIKDSFGAARCVCIGGYIKYGDHCIISSTVSSVPASCDIARDCSPNADCIYNETSRLYTCRCIRGYYGDGYTCSLNPGRRTVPKYCILGKCFCPVDYTEKGEVCVENEEGQPIEGVSCNVNNNCHLHAQCVYNVTIKEFQCQCNAGYDGDGIDCTEVEASCQKIDNCDYHASCQVEEMTGRAMCICNPRYQGDGIHCVYTGHCTSDGDCGQNEECIFDEKTDGYECQCVSGFVKHDGGCIEKKKCPKCHQYGECINSPSVTSDPYCQCIVGYTGDGVTQCTVLPPPCNIINNCSPFAVCDYNSSLPGYACKCKKGYDGNGTYCFSSLTCAEEPELCHRNASCVINRKGNQPRCECNQGFIGNGSYCTGIPKQEGDFLLLNHGMATLRLPLQPSASNPGYPIQLQAQQTAIGLDIDCVEGRVYWSDYSNKVIKSSTYKGKNIQPVITTNISFPEDLAVDWINRDLYWTDSDKDTIEAIKLDGTDRRTIISTGLVNPRGIAVHPYKRKLFWSDWNRALPKIEWSNLDGSERSTLVQGSRVQVPNSIDIDWTTDDLCWADAGTKAIECVGIESGYSKTAVTNCSYPFGLAITRDKYYWTDWSLNKVGNADKRGNKMESLSTPLALSGKMYGIVAVPTKCP